MSAAPELAPEPLRIALVGSPNSGKTTLFNALTGARAKVGNYAGVTVERREGALRQADRPVRVLDLPGTYSLEGETPDEQVVEGVLHGRFAGEAEPDAVLVVVDGTTLARGLGLVAQVLELRRPTAVVVTMVDEVRARGGRVDLPRLARRLGVPVLGVVGHRGVGLRELRALLQAPGELSRATPPAAADPEARFAWVDEVAREVGALTPKRDARTDRIDRVLLHPVAGVAIFGVLMVLLFQSIFTWAVPAMDWIDGFFGAVGRVSARALPPGLARDLWTDGVLAGVGSVLVFLPQIVILFALIHFLEDVGYMARAAFVVDRVMGWVGLQGRCFVSLLSSYACAIPGIMAARSVASPRDRLATILVAPFMTCSARLPVYTLLIAAFVPARDALGPLGLQGLVMLGLYLLGTLTALASALLLKSTLLRGTLTRFYMELPPYRVPTLRLLATQVWGSAWRFLKRAGTVILLVSLALWAVLSFPRVEVDPALSASAQAQAQLEASAGARVGRALEPAIEPLGFDWKIGVGLLASLAAREVMVATLAQIYAVGDADDFDGLRAALVADADFGLATALSLLVFFIFALQCLSTVVVMARESGSWRWPALAFGYMLALAYGASFITYRVATAFGA